VSYAIRTCFAKKKICLLRAAAAWPSEFLYPRPLSTDKIDIGLQPTAVDQYARSASAPGEKPSEQPFNSNPSTPTLPCRRQQRARPRPLPGHHRTRSWHISFFYRHFTDRRIEYSPEWCRFIIAVGLSNRDINDCYEGNHSIRKPPAELDPAESFKHARKTREPDDNRDFSSNQRRKACNRCQTRSRHLVQFKRRTT